MFILEYDSNPNLTPEERIQSLKESVQRALEDLGTDTVNEAARTQKVIVQIQKDFDEYKKLYVEDLKVITGEFQELVAEVGNFEEAVVGNLRSQDAEIESLKGNQAEFEQVVTESIKAQGAEFEKVSGEVAEFKRTVTEDLNAQNATIEQLDGKYAEFEKTVTDELEADQAEFEQTITKDLEAKHAELEETVTESLRAQDAEIEQIEGKRAEFEQTFTDYIFAEEGVFRFVMIDRTNIDTAWIEDLLVQGKFLANDINAATGSFSKYLTGVNIVGDNITGGTISTERLIIRDPENNTGILFAINNGVIDQTGLTEEQLKRLTLDGRIITAQSITAEKINVFDLFAQDITSTGDFNMGGKGALVYDKETDSLTIRANYIEIGKRSVATKDEVEAAKNAALIEAYDEYAIGADTITEPSEEKWSTDQPQAGEGIYIWQRRVSVYGNRDIVYGPAVCITGNKGDTGEDATNVRIYSSRGTVFKNNEVSTLLSVTVFKGGERITDIETLKKVYGISAHLQWSWARGENTGIILSTDTRLSESGFAFTVSPSDVDSNITFQCDVIAD